MDYLLQNGRETLQQSLHLEIRYHSLRKESDFYKALPKRRSKHFHRNENFEYFVPNYANWFCKSLLCKIKCPIAGSDLNGAKLWKNIHSFCWPAVSNYFHFSSFKISSCFVSLSLKMALILFWQFFYFY